MNVSRNSLFSILSILMGMVAILPFPVKALSTDPPQGSGTVVAPLAGDGKGAAELKTRTKENGKGEDQTEKAADRLVKGSGKKKARTSEEKTPLPDERLTVKDVMEALNKDRNLSGKNLRGLHLTGLDLNGCNLKGADLRHADLERTDLFAANLELAELSGANMRMTDLRSTSLRGARMEGTILDGAIWEDGTICGKNSTGFCRESRHSSDLKP